MATRRCPYKVDGVQCRWAEHAGNVHNVLEPDPQYKVPHDAEMHVHEFERWVGYIWRRGDQIFGYKESLELYECVETFAGPTHWVRRHGDIREPAPPEAPSIFATRPLTLDELLDPDLFNPLCYEPILDRMVAAGQLTADGPSLAPPSRPNPIRPEWR